MKSPTVSQPLPPDECLEDALIVAALVQRDARATRKQRRDALERALAIQRRMAELKRERAA